MKKQNQISASTFSQTLFEAIRQQDEADLILHQSALLAGRYTYLHHQTHTMYILNQMAHRNILSYDQTRTLIQQEVERTNRQTYTFEKS